MHPSTAYDITVLVGRPLATWEECQGGNWKRRRGSEGKTGKDIFFWGIKKWIVAFLYIINKSKYEKARMRCYLCNVESQKKAPPNPQAQA